MGLIYISTKRGTLFDRHITSGHIVPAVETWDDGTQDRYTVRNASRDRNECQTRTGVPRLIADRPTRHRLNSE